MSLPDVSVQSIQCLTTEFVDGNSIEDKNRSGVRQVHQNCSLQTESSFDGPEYPYRLTLDGYRRIGNAEAVQQCKDANLVNANAITHELDLSAFDEVDLVTA